MAAMCQCHNCCPGPSHEQGQCHKPSRNRIEKMIPGGINSWCGPMGAKHGSLAPMWYLAVLQPISFSSHPVWLGLARPQVDPMVLASWDDRPWGMLHAGDFPEPDLCPKAILIHTVFFPNKPVPPLFCFPHGAVSRQGLPPRRPPHLLQNLC